MKLGCLDYNFNFLPFPSSMAKLGTYSFMGLAKLGAIKRYRYTKRALEKISSMGFEGVQVMCEDAEQMTLGPEQLSDLADELNLSITSLGGYTNFFEKSKMKRFREVVEYAHAAGINIICTHSGKGADKQAMIENMARAVDYAAANGITIALENSPLHAISTIGDVSALLKEIPKLRLNFDPANFNLSGMDTLEAATKLGKYFVHVHAKDSIKLFSFPPLGKGEVPWTELIKLLKKQNYNGYLVVEFEGKRNPIEQTIKDKEYLEKMMKK
ncbi:MAG: sugar phosphate isomerase/epimerase [Candidatus Aenigmarchaeota archaeon]|nr:sugar phosphate isomerase/epimerase [Candidatus Aenigmarchaeota archaeon]